MLTRFIFRSLCALLVGFLLVSQTDKMPTLLVQIIGGLFILSGVLAFIGYFNTRRQLHKASLLTTDDGKPFDSSSRLLPMFPVVGIGSLALGVLLLVWPSLFVNILMYVLGALLLLIGGTQIAALLRYAKISAPSWASFIIPVAIIAAGIFVILKPMEAASLPFTILGIAYIAYGVSEFFIGIRLYRLRRRIESAQPAEAEIITEVPEIQDAEIVEGD